MPTPEERKVRGDVLLGHFKFARKTWGSDGLLRVAVEAGFHPDQINARSWYPAEMDRKLLRAEDHLYGDSTGDIAQRSGYHAATHLGILSYLARVVPPRTMARKGVERYDDAFNWGRLHIADEGTDEDGTEFIVMRFGEAWTDPILCKSWAGAMLGMLHLTRKGGTIEHTSCVHAGGEHCDYRLMWK